MDAINEFFSDYWIYLTVAGFLLLFTVPWLFVWRARRNRNWLVANGRSAQAKILKITASGLTVGTSSSSNNGGGSMRGVNLLLEVHPENGQSYQVKTREQLHLLDLSRITPGMMVELRIHPTKPNKVVVSQWSK